MDSRTLSRLGGLCCFLFIAFNSANAQDEMEMPDLSGPLTLDDCIEIGLQYAVSIRTGALAIQSGELGVDDAQSAYLPNIRTNGAYLANDRIDLDFNRENFDWGVTADYTIWDHGRRKISLNRARRNLESSETQLERDRQDLIISIVRAYYRLLEAQELVNLDESLLELSQGNAAQVRAFMEVGNAVEADVAAAEVRVASDELALLNDENALAIARALLPRTLGFSPDAAIEVADDRAFALYQQTHVFERYAKTLEETVAVALRKRPAIHESEIALRLRELDLTLANLERYPVLTASANYDVALDDYLRERENFKDFRSWDASARLTFPIFDGGFTRRRVEQADLTLQQARERHDDLKRAVALEATQAYYDLIQAEKRLDISAVQVRNAELNLEVTSGRYSQDLVILLELLDAQTQFGQANTNQIQTYFEYKIAQRQLARAIGEATP